MMLYEKLDEIGWEAVTNKINENYYKVVITRKLYKWYQDSQQNCPRHLTRLPLFFDGYCVVDRSGVDDDR